MSIAKQPLLLTLFTYICISLPQSANLSASVVPKTSPDICDLEWDRIKGLPPISKGEFERILANPEKAGTVRLSEGVTAPARMSAADVFYYLARVPFVIGIEDIPTSLQREAWLDKAATMGHKAAKAALMHRRYLSREIPQERRVDRSVFLTAAVDAGGAGDPEFATILMDTARDYNGGWNCRTEDRSSRTPPNSNGCNAQSVVRQIETRKWAEIAARGGNPNAKLLMCRMHVYGTYPQWGFEKNEKAALSWCFASALSACSASDAAVLLGALHSAGVADLRTLLQPSTLEAESVFGSRATGIYPYSSK